MIIKVKLGIRLCACIGKYCQKVTQGVNAEVYFYFKLNNTIVKKIIDFNVLPGLGYQVIIG